MISFKIMEKFITSILCITNKFNIPNDINKIILNKILAPSYHQVIQYKEYGLVSELSIDFIEQIKIITNFDINYHHNYCVVLKNSALLLPVINYMNYENYIFSVDVLEKLKDKFNMHFQLPSV